ncbi:MAG: HAMP domain-containing protein [Chloroflexi bacterium]|nr:HAMP domain-containing protein [Chloroflexota bacterium]
MAEDQTFTFKPKQHGMLYGLKRAKRDTLSLRSVQGTLLLLLLNILIPVLLYQVGAHYRTLQMRRDQELQANLEMARSTAATFGDFIQDVLHQELAIGLSLASLQPSPLEQADLILTASAEQSRAVREVSLLDPQGRIVASSRPEAVGEKMGDQAYFRQIVQGRGWVVSELLRPPAGGDPSLMVAQGIRDDRGNLQGVVGTTVDAQRLGEVLKMKPVDPGAISIADGRGWLVYRYPEHRVDWEERNLQLSQPDIVRPLAGEDVTSSFAAPTDGRNWIASYTPIGATGLVAVAVRPEVDVMSPLTQDAFLDSSLFLLVTVAAFIIALTISRNITVPLSSLREHALAIGRGQLGRRIEVAGPIEMEELAEAFNRMAEAVSQKEAQLRSHARQLEQEVLQRTAAVRQLEQVNRELEAFSYTVSHDLRSPLRVIAGFTRALLEDHAHSLDTQGKDYLQRVNATTLRMAQLIDDLMELSRVTASELHRETVDLSDLARTIATELRKSQPERQVYFVIRQGLVANGDAQLLRVALENLLANAWKFTSKRPAASIEFGLTRFNSKQAYFVRDNGAGFDMANADKLFTPFQRLHSAAEFRGTGVGLATVQRIIHRHGGSVWAEGVVEQGATFYFTL